MNYLSFSAWWLAIKGDTTFCVVFGAGGLFLILYLIYDSRIVTKFRKILSRVGKYFIAIAALMVFAGYCAGCISRLACSNFLLTTFVIALFQFIFSSGETKKKGE